MVVGPASSGKTSVVKALTNMALGTGMGWTPSVIGLDPSSVSVRVGCSSQRRDVVTIPCSLACSAVKLDPRQLFDVDTTIPHPHASRGQPPRIAAHVRPTRHHGVRRADLGMVVWPPRAHRTRCGCLA